MSHPSPAATGGKVGAVNPRLEEPLSLQYYALSRAITTRVKIHPNLITSARLLLMIALTVLFYASRCTVLCAVLLQVCFFLDHLDGEMARTYNLITKFGDYFDHVLDVTYEIPLLLILVWKLYRTPLFYPIVLGIGALMYLSTMLIACQEVVLQRETDVASQSLQGLQRMCPAGMQNAASLRYLRYFGQSLLHLAIGAAMIYANW